MVASEQHAGDSSGKPPEPITSGPSQAEGIARFACRTNYGDLTPKRRERLKVSVVDALACAISALGAPPIEACRAQAQEFGATAPDCTLIGGGRANLIYAAFYNTALVRYVDYMDSYLASGGLCHPSDNIGAILTASEHADLTGKDFLGALALAYQVEARLTAAIPFMADGFDLTTPLSFSLAAGASKALGLDQEQTTAAIGIDGDLIPLLVARTTPISQWKGLSSSQVALGCVHGVLLASRGVTGPRYVFEGPNGLAHAVGMPIDIDWDSERLDCFDRLALKSYNTAVPGQSSIFCMLELRRAHAIDPAQVESIEDHVFQAAYDFMGGGSFGPKTDVHTKEDADHSLPYLLAVALLDGDVQPAQLVPARIGAPDVQDLLRRVTVKPDDAFTARYPGEVPSRVTVRLKDGTSHTHEVKNYPGFPSWPFTWDEIGAKFDKLVAGRADDALGSEIKAAVRSLETIDVKDLMRLLGRVKVERRA
ncbi:MAG TPA: MmgE/PrpD family protein [Solirubrobacteraceae bacterium]|jgi:2-methylcitrate dehydratase|nr:MmgE/PrpD family protein [Solirubrobacteraceae bacterium]